MRWRELIARTISQTARAAGAPNTTTTIKKMDESMGAMIPLGQTPVRIDKTIWLSIESMTMWGLPAPRDEGLYFPRFSSSGELCTANP
jgi:hypothetical protein